MRIQPRGGARPAAFGASGRIAVGLALWPNVPRWNVGSAVRQDLSFSWDAGGNLKSRTDHTQGGLTETFRPAPRE